MNSSVPPKRSSGALKQLREPLDWPEEKPFKILSIDGGGIRGIFPACILTELEKRYLCGNPIGFYFDLITGTSTGGIIAIALAKGLPAIEVSRLYLEKGADIFPPASGLTSKLRRLRRYFRVRYDSSRLANELNEVLGNDSLKDCKVRLCIPAFEGAYGEPWIYKTPHHPDYHLDASTPLSTVAMATAAAPTYLQALEHQGYILVDGGLLANNPIMVGVVDALACYRISRRQIHVLSLGCGAAPYRVISRHIRGGMIQWRDAVAAAMTASSKNAFGQASLLIGRDRILRLDVTEPEGSSIALDDYQRARRELPGQAVAVVDKFGEVVRSRFLKNACSPCSWTSHESYHPLD